MARALKPYQPCLCLTNACYQHTEHCQSMSKIIPILRSFDETLAAAFYIDFLGAQETFRHRFDKDAPLYLGIVLRGAEIHLSEHHGDATPGSSIRININSLLSFYQSISAKKYRYARPAIVDQPWGQDLPITDPFGNRLIFSEQS